MAKGSPLPPGCRDLIEHERTGLRVPYRDTRALEAAVRRLLADRDLRAQLDRPRGSDSPSPSARCTTG